MVAFAEMSLDNQVFYSLLELRQETHVRSQQQSRFKFSINCV